MPHWTADSAIYHTVFRLADSLPSEVLAAYHKEWAALIAEAGDDPAPAIRDRLQFVSTKVEKYLDAGHGACWLRRLEIGDLVAQAVTHFDHSRYRLHAWCIMPNHVHVVVQPIGIHELPSILHSWKSFTSSQANKLLMRSGSFWQKESYDHIVRSATDLERTIRYVRENPTNAGLRAWRWVWPV